MKVLENGPGWNLKRKCTGYGNGNGGCESILLVEPDDIYVTTNTDYIGNIDYYYTFRCPVCGAETDIAERNLPSRICAIAMKKYKEKIESRRLGR